MPETFCTPFFAGQASIANLLSTLLWTSFLQPSIGMHNVFRTGQQQW
jgi:hypothetical protein